MARKTTEASDNKPSRSFKVDTSSLAAERPVLEPAYYAGQIFGSGVSFTNKDQTETFYTLAVQQKREWNRAKKSFKFFPGEYEIAGSFNFNAVLFSKKAIATLATDEPKVYRGRIFLSFTDDLKLDAVRNTVFKTFLTTLDLENESFDEAVDYVWDEDIVTDENIRDLVSFAYTEDEAEAKANALEEIEAIKALDNVEDILNWTRFYRKYFAVVAESVDGKKAKVKVIKQPISKSNSAQTNAIGSDSGVCGILAYVEGCEDDLDD